MKKITEKKKSSYIIPNLKRAFQVLECIAKHHHGISFMQLLEDLKCSKTTLFRILITLENTGFITTSEEGGFYFLSRKIMTLAHSALDECNLPAESFQTMRQLRDSVGETVMLGALLDGECVMIEQEVSTKDFNFCGKLGMKSPLHASAPGKALLAFQPLDVSEKLIQKFGLEKFTQKTICKKDALENELQKIRLKGYSTDDGEVIEGLRCVAAPIFNSKGYNIAVIWITAPTQRISLDDFEKIGKEVCLAAKNISTKLGHK